MMNNTKNFIEKKCFLRPNAMLPVRTHSSSERNIDPIQARMTRTEGMYRVGGTWTDSCVCYSGILLLLRVEKKRRHCCLPLRNAPNHQYRVFQIPQLPHCQQQHRSVFLGLYCKPVIQQRHGHYANFTSLLKHPNTFKN